MMDSMIYLPNRIEFTPLRTSRRASEGVGLSHISTPLRTSRMASEGVIFYGDE